MSSGHVHSTVKNDQGQDICRSCGQIVITPILDFDDSRLQGAGAMRSPTVEYPDELPPLPIVLVTLYYDGPEYGYSKAPIAPYVELVAMKEEAVAGSVAEDFWFNLSKL
jgi:hypothetical protein